MVGRDPGAHGFWDKYIHWADGAKEPFRVVAIYRRALGQPLKQLDKYMSGRVDDFCPGVCRSVMSRVQGCLASGGSYGPSP